MLVGLVLSTGGALRPAAGVDPASMTTLSAAEAADLASRAEGLIGLDAVTQLSPDAALQLARHTQGLSLDGLPTVDAATARALAMHGRLDRFDQDAEFDVGGILEKIDAYFASSTGEELDVADIDALLANLAGPPDEETDTGSDATGSDAAEADPWLSLGGLQTISPEVASALAIHDGPLLLDGLTMISTEVASSLATHSGELSLAGLTQLSDDARAALAEHDGPVTLPDALVSAADRP